VKASNKPPVNLNLGTDDEEISTPKAKAVAPAANQDSMDVDDDLMAMADEILAE
jgi:hypothetical protein